MEKIKKVNSNIPVLEKRCRCCKKGNNLNGTEEDFHNVFISRNWFRLNFRLHLNYISLYFCQSFNKY